MTLDTKNLSFPLLLRVVGIVVGAFAAFGSFIAGRIGATANEFGAVLLFLTFFGAAKVWEDWNAPTPPSKPPTP